MHPNVLEFRQKLEAWLTLKSFNLIDIKKDVHPKNSDIDDYRFATTAGFYPKSLDMMQINVVVTEEGYAGIGIETRERVAKKINATNWRSGYAIGFEPRIRDMRTVIDILEAVSIGKVSLGLHIWPLFGIVKIKGYIDASCITKSFSDLGFCTKADPTAELMYFIPWK